MKYSSYLFDLDGTLIDSMDTFVVSLLRLLDNNNIKYGDDIVKIITPLGGKGIAAYFRSLGLDMSDEEFLHYAHTNSIRNYENTIPAKSNVIETVKKLKAAGAELNILTASPHILLDPCIKRLGIWDLFTNCWSCNDFNTTKADPDIYVRVAEKLGRDIDSILFLDDNFDACNTAKTAGMKVCGVYDSYSEDYVEDMKKICDHYIYDFSELDKFM